METKANHRNLTKVLLIGGEPDPGFLATSTKIGWTCLYFDRYMSI